MGKKSSGWRKKSSGSQHRISSSFSASEHLKNQQSRDSETVSLSAQKDAAELQKSTFFDVGSDECATDEGSLMCIDFYPFAYALYNSDLSSHCWYCLAESKSLKRCTGCSCAMFCDQKCHFLGWKDHKIECKALKGRSEIPDIEVRLLGRIVTRYKAIKQGKDKQDASFYLARSSKRSIMDIWAHTELIRKDAAAMKKFNGIYENLVQFYGEKHLLSKDEIFELHCRDYINRHAISDAAYLQEIGKGLYLDLCAYDHSCRPNAIYTCKGFVATLRALDKSVNLLDRSSTFYSYIELLNTTQQRRKLLKDTWYFDCQCSRCTDPEDGLLSSMLCPNCSEEPERLIIFGSSPYKDPVTQIITCPKCQMSVPQDKVLEAIGAMRFIDRIVEKQEVDQMPKDQGVRFLNDLKSRFSIILPRINVYFCKIIQLLIPMVDPSDNNTLLNLHLQSEECVRFCFPANHPAVAFHLRNIGIFYLREGHPHRAQLYFEMARDIMSFTLGKDHPMTTENQSMLEDATHEVKEARKIMLGGDFPVPKVDRSASTVHAMLQNDGCSVEKKGVQREELLHHVVSSAENRQSEALCIEIKSPQDATDSEAVPFVSNYRDFNLVTSPKMSPLQTSKTNIFADDDGLPELLE